MSKYFCATFTQKTVTRNVSNSARTMGIPCTYVLLDIYMGIDQQARIILVPGFGSDNDSQHHKMSGFLRKTVAQLKKTK
jgi:hypothetical protein